MHSRKSNYSKAVPKMSNRRSPQKIMALVGLLLIPLFSGLFAGTAGAHDGNSSVIYLDVFPDGTAAGQIEHPVLLLNDLFDLELDPDNATAEDIAAIAPLVSDYNVDNLSIAAPDGSDWGISFTGEVQAVETENRVYAAFEFDIDTVFESAPRAFDVTFDGIVPNSSHFAFVVLRTDPVTGVFLNEGNPVGFEEGELIGEGELAVEIDAIQTGLVENGRLITDSSPTLDVDLDNPSIWRAFTGTVALGMEHIFIGTDHILFVLVLLLPTVMVFSLADGWGPVPSLKDGLFRVLKIATSFTIAHSITLALGGLGIVELNSKLVETIIAVSIIATAFHNLKPIFANREALIAFAFGIFHGFGFAGLLTDLGVGNGQRVLSLLGFNIGVEIGQAFIILLLFPALFLLRRTRVYVPFLRIGSMALAAVATIWAIERIFETSLGIDNVLERFTRAPRVFLLIAIATAIAAGIRQIEAARGNLAPIDQTLDLTDKVAEKETVSV